MAAADSAAAAVVAPLSMKMPARALLLALLPAAATAMPNGTGNAVTFAPYTLVPTAVVPESFLSFNFDWCAASQPGSRQPAAPRLPLLPRCA